MVFTSVGISPDWSEDANENLEYASDKSQKKIEFVVCGESKEN